MKKRRTIVLVISISLIFLFACSPNSTDLAKQYAEIYNTHDVKKIISLYAPDAVFEVVGQFTLSGKEQIRNLTQYDSVLNIRMSLFDIEKKGNSVSCNLSETNNWLKTSGIGEAHYTINFIFEKGFIKNLKAEAKPETQQAFMQVLSPLIEWAKGNKADLLAEMMPEGRFVYNAENARKTLALLRSWKEKSEKKSYIFSYFVGNGEDGLHLAYSWDGLRWKTLNRDQSMLTPRVGEDKLMRDPCIIQGPSGRFHMVWTISWKEKGIGYASSPDLIHWSEQKLIPVMAHEPKAENCWAPELFYDRRQDQFLIFWATTIPGRFTETDNQSNQGPPSPGRNHRIYFVTSRDFRTFSKTKLFYNQGFNIIDATLIEEGNRFVMFLKDETNKPFLPQKNIRMAFSNRAQGPYGPPSQPITGKYWAEGPTAIKIGAKWFVYFDKYRQHQYGVVVSSDLTNWSDWSEKLEMPKEVRHGTVLEVSGKILKNLLELK